MNSQTPAPPPFLADLLFAPGQHPHSIGLVLVPTMAEMHAMLDAQQTQVMEVEEAGGGKPRAACVFDFDGVHRFGFVVFAQESLTPGLLVHELTHAAMCFVGHKVMTSKAVAAKSEEDQSAYFEEACAHTVQQLFEQAYEVLFGNQPMISLAEHQRVIQELNDRLIERAQDIVTQAKRIDETWRETMKNRRP